MEGSWSSEMNDGSVTFLHVRVQGFASYKYSGLQHKHMQALKSIHNNSEKTSWCGIDYKIIVCL